MRGAFPAVMAALPLVGLVCCSSAPAPAARSAATPRPAPAASRPPASDPGGEVAGREMAARLFARDPLSSDGRLLRYVTMVGRAAAGTLSSSPSLRFGVTQSEVPYSLAFPGRFVVISRGLLFLMSSESDLAVALSREICRCQQPGELRESPGEGSDPAIETRFDACGARMASLAGYDVAGFLNVLESLKDRAVSARELSDLQARLQAYRAIPEFFRGGKTLADRFRSSAIL